MTYISKIRSLLKDLPSNKFVLSALVTAIIATVSVGGASFASANAYQVPPNEQACMRNYREYHFSSTQQCVNWWNKNHGGVGYGGTKPVPPKHHGYHFYFHFSYFEHHFRHFHF